VPAYQCSIEHTLAGQPAVCVVAFARTDSLGAETLAEAAIVAENVAIAWKARFLPNLTARVLFLRVTARGVIDQAVSGTSISTSQSGSRDVAALPSFVAARVKFQTATPGRAGRGRTGVPGLAEDNTESNSPNLLTGAAQAALATALSSFVGDLALLTPTVFPVVVSRFKGTDGAGKPLPRPGGPLVSPVTSSSVDSTVGTRVSRIR
jgi:hypothetical protein